MKFELPVILDGAMGTQLYKRGYTAGICPEMWTLEHRDDVVSIQRAYVDAGSQIIYTPTFGANRTILERNRVHGKVREYNLALASISKEAADGRALIAGDMGPTGAMLKPLGNVTFEELVDIYTEQASALKEAGVDLFVIETMMTVAEARAAVLAVRSVSDKPIFVSFTCGANGRTMTGTDICAALEIMQSMGVSAFGMNCSVGPGEMTVQMRRLSAIAKIPLIAKPNAGLPVTEGGTTTYNVRPEEFASYVPGLVEAGVGMFGGCCGTDETFIAALKDKLGEIEKDAAGKNGTGTEPGSCSEKLCVECAQAGVCAVMQPAREAGLCATERDIFDLDDYPEIAETEVFECDDELEDNLLDADPGEPVCIRFTPGDDLEAFAEAQFSVAGPLCIACEDAEVLEKVLRLYQGRAVYSGSLSALKLAPLVKKYGLIILN